MYPWGNNSCDGLTTLCSALDIDSHSGVVNCCAFTHIMYALISLKVITMTDLLLAIRAPRRHLPNPTPQHIQDPSGSLLDSQDSHPVHNEGITQQPSLESLSSLYADYKYPDDLDIESEFFPFDSKADAIIYLWDAPCKSNRISCNRLTSLLQALPLIGVDGLSCKDGQTFRDKYEVRIPLMKTHTIQAHKSIRHHRKTQKLPQPMNHSEMECDDEDIELDRAIPQSQHSTLVDVPVYL